MGCPIEGNSRHNNAMHAKSGLRVVLEWKIYRPDSVIADVITLPANAIRRHIAATVCRTSSTRTTYVLQVDTFGVCALLLVWQFLAVYQHLSHFILVFDGCSSSTIRVASTIDAWGRLLGSCKSRQSQLGSDSRLCPDSVLCCSRVRGGLHC